MNSPEKKVILDDNTGCIELVPGFDQVTSLEDIFPGLQMQQETIKLFGKEVLQPRLSALYGKEGTRYRYSGKTFEARSWSGWLENLAMRCSEIAGTSFNTALVNYYRSGTDSMGLHADNEPELGQNPVIASVSYGATRKMIFRKNDDAAKLELPLEHGDLLIMKEALQHCWKHELPKQRKVVAPRLNITFRHVLKS